MTNTTDSWTRISTRALQDGAARRLVRDCARRLSDLSPTAPMQSIELVRTDTIERALRLPSAAAPAATLFISVLCDLRAQGWRLRLSARAIDLAAPITETDSVEARKAQIRSAHLLERDSQLCQPSVRAFVRGMETRRLTRTGWHSVFSLMRDGRELAATLRSLSVMPEGEPRFQGLRACIDPYIQVVESDSVCEFTGLKLLDVWRYFRHTWNTAYLSTPGRKVWILVRDRAAPNHPVIGIGALGSAIVQLAPRDTWIGWSADSFLAELLRHPTDKWARWLLSSLTTLIRGIYVDDFRSEGILGPNTLARPTEKAIARLRATAAEAWRVHRLYPGRTKHKAAVVKGQTSAWKVEALTYLFRAKRAEHLAELLEAKRAIASTGPARPSAAMLRRVTASAAGRRAVRTVLRYTKAAHAGVDMMDITICGAVAPYSALLGGKLVGLLLASPEVTAAYNERYRDSESIIASSMAGRPIRRRPHLVLLGTTSLYGVASSQYNRLRMPATAGGGRAGDELAYLEIGKTVGYGSFHFSTTTMRTLEVVLARMDRGRPVNSIFGEGVNPKLRKVRAALDVLGLPSDLLLQHGSPRIIYAVPLARNFRDVLLGLATRATPICPRRPDSTQRMVEFWRQRWLARRIENSVILDRVAEHSVTYPVHHGARVPLPVVKGEEGPLFAELELAPSAPPGVLSTMTADVT